MAGGNRQGNGINQLSEPYGFYIDDDETLYVADASNHRIVEWKSSATSDKVVAGGNGYGSGTHQLFYPSDVIVDKDSDSLIICDRSNKRLGSQMSTVKCRQVKMSTTKRRQKNVDR